MISNHLSLVEQQRSAAESLSSKIAQFIAAGGNIEQLPSPPGRPLFPPRSNKIDPETVLKRKPKSLSWSDRKALRLMADSL